MSVQFKAYLYEDRPCRFKEVRRFSVDHDVSTNYDYLRGKVASVFPNIVDNFSLQWKDADGDLIWFNSDEELIQALGQHSGSEFKLYIKENSADGCSQPRCGPRYRRQQFSHCPPQFGFFNPEAFGNFPFFTSATEQKKEASSEKPGTSSTNEKSQPSCQDYLQEMGNVVAEFLQPFGVDVDIKVDNKKKEEKAAPEAEPPSSSKASATKPDTETSPDQSSQSQSQWTIINNEKTEEKEKSADANMEVDEDAKLHEALERLVAMGFNDHGGWLTNLLKASDCDIGRALDAMQPHRSRKN